MQIQEQIYFKLQMFWEYLNSFDFLESFFNNRFYLILMVIVLIHLKNASYKSMLLCALINIPGTVLHEAMHFFVGLFFNARPRNFSLLPHRDDNGGYVMGSVSFSNVTAYNAVPAALAPLLLLPIGFYANRYVLPEIPPTFVNYVLYILLQTIIIENAIPSSTDFKVARMFFSGIVMYTVLAGILLFTL